MFAKSGFSILKNFVPRIALYDTCGQRYVHKDFHGPEWDLKRHRVVETYGDSQVGMRQKNNRPDRWDYYDQVVWRPNYRYEDGQPKEGEVFHVCENVKYMAIKFFNVCQLVRGRTVEDADKQLQQVPRKGAIVLRQALKEAIDKAVNEHGIEYRSNLWIAECFAQRSFSVKGIRRHARERWGNVEYEYSNLFLRLAEGKPPPYVERTPPDRDGFYDGKRHIDNLRDRRLKYGL